MSQQSSPLKVVLVDDAPLILTRLQTMISSLEGVDVVGSAENVTDALALIERLSPDAVVLDLRLPDGNGIEILQQVKQRAGAPVVIVLTAQALPQIREKCLSLGADYFFDKSLESRHVVDVLAALTDGVVLPNGTGGASPGNTADHNRATGEKTECSTANGAG